MRARVQAVASELLSGDIRTEPGKAKLIRTRELVKRGWHLVREILINQGQPELALHVSRFGEAMAPPLTEKEQRAAGILEHARERQISERPPASR